MNAIRVGIEVIRAAAASSRSASVSTLPKVISGYCAEAASKTGANSRHGSHHAAQTLMNVTSAPASRVFRPAARGQASLVAPAAADEAEVMNTTEIPSASIVVAVDGSEHADRAVLWGANQAGLEGRPVRLVHVHEDEADSRILERAAALARETCPEVDVQALSLTGEPEHVLIALSQHARYVVMGSHGHGVLRSALLGSVSAAVAKHAACPVVVCRPSQERFAKTAVVVGADGTPESLPVIEFAFQQASLRGIQLNVVHCYDDPRTTGWRRRVVGHQDVEGLRLLLAESVAGLSAQYPDVHVTSRLEHGPVEELLDRGLRPWELVVVGRRPPHSSSRFSDDTIATAVLERSQSTVVVVPEAPSADTDESAALRRHSEEAPVGGLP